MTFFVCIHALHMIRRCGVTHALRCVHSTGRQLKNHRSSRRPKAGVAGGLVRADQEDGIISKADDSQLFPFAEPFHVDGNRELSAQQVIDLLYPLSTPERNEKIAEVVRQRTFDFVPVVEGLYDLGNVAAVCRSCDGENRVRFAALGFGQIHVIDGIKSRYKQSARTSKGAEKWLDVHVWKNTSACIEHLKAQGRQVYVTHFDDDAKPISAVDFTKPTAIVFGNEADGVSEESLAAADGSVIIPMHGFAQSFNISVAAAIVLHEARQQRLRQLGYHGNLDEHQQLVMRAVMMIRAQQFSSCKGASAAKTATVQARAASFLSQFLESNPPDWQQGRVTKGARRRDARQRVLDETRHSREEESAEANGHTNVATLSTLSIKGERCVNEFVI